MKLSENMKSIGFYLLLCGIFIGMIISCASALPSDTTEQNSLFADGLKIKYLQNPDDPKIVLAYAQKLVDLGEFAAAQKVIEPWLNNANILPEFLNLAAKINCLTGNYTEAETQYNILLKQYPEFRVAAELGLRMVYSKTNQYHKASQLLPLKELLESPR